MDGQMNLFENETFSSPQVVDGHFVKNSADNQIKCFEKNLANVKFMTPEELFSGYNTIKAITFSYDLAFIDKVMQQFDYGEILLGAEHIVRADSKMNDIIVNVVTNAYEAGQTIKKYQSMIQMMSEEKLIFRTPEFIMDHRKIYLLQADDGRTRVITGSANMSSGAWNGSHMETYDYDDSQFAYEEYLKDYETEWENAAEIPLSIVSSKKEDEDLVGDNPILKKVMDMEHAVVLQHDTDPIVLERKRYAFDHEKLGEEYDIILKGAPDNKKGVTVLNPKSIEKIKHNARMELKKVKINNVSEDYPELTFDFAERTAFINKSAMDLTPTSEEVNNDINEFLKIFQNFDDFVGDTERLKENHFKILNAVFSSPFNASIRCNALIKGVWASSLPMFLLVSSEKSNCGKTFMIKAILKMMTGKDLELYNKNTCNIEMLRKIQNCHKGTPVFVDEIDAKYMSYLKTIVKDVESCENEMRINQPMIIFASNDIPDPEEIVRKRMVFIKLDGALPSTIDRSEIGGKGNAILRRLGNGLYREYLRRMIDEVAEIIDYIKSSEEIPDSWYPDIMKISSKTLISIFEDHGYEIPQYMRELSWNDDYSEHAGYISEDAIKEIGDMYKREKKSFLVSDDEVIIDLGEENKKRATTWISVLPPEMEAKKLPGKNFKIAVNRKKLEEKLNFKFHTPIFKRR